MSDKIENQENEAPKNNLKRRDVLKSLATIPIVGAVLYSALRKKQYDRLISNNINVQVGMSHDVPPAIPPSKIGGKPLRIGLIGHGIRGKHLAKGLGFVHPTMINDLKKAASENVEDKRYEDYLKQENLGVQVTAVCDIFRTYEQMAAEAGANINREGTGGKMGAIPKIFKTYKELCASPDVDAVIIAAPDHWHGPMTIEAAKNGKHVYCEKPMTWSVDETYEVRRAVKENKIVFQLGHQGRQTDSYIKAQEAIDKGVIGKVNLNEVTTNRNGPNGAWVYDIHKDANQQTIDWKQFIG